MHLQDLGQVSSNSFSCCIFFSKILEIYCIVGHSLNYDFWLPFLYLQEEFEDTTGVIRTRKAKKHRKHNGQEKKYKRTNNDLQNITHKTIDRVTRIPLKTGGELRWYGRVSSSCSTSSTIFLRQADYNDFRAVFSLDCFICVYKNYFKTSRR